MFVSSPAKFLKVSENSFTNDSGQLVPYYRVNIIDNDAEPCVLPCSRDVFESGGLFGYLSDVEVTLSITYRNNGVRCRVVGIDPLTV